MNLIRMVEDTYSIDIESIKFRVFLHRHGISSNFRLLIIINNSHLIKKKQYVVDILEFTDNVK